MKTIKGIYLDLNESDYTFEFEDIVFYFSSMQYLEKFKTNVESYITEQTIKLELKYKLNVEFRRYLAISYYKQLEKRGFRILLNEREYNNNLVVYNTILQ